MSKDHLKFLLMEARLDPEMVEHERTCLAKAGHLRPEQFRIVGSAEADPIKGFISNNSPLGAALMGKRVGQSATYTAPTGTRMTFKVLKIS